MALAAPFSRRRRGCGRGRRRSRRCSWDFSWCARCLAGQATELEHRFDARIVPRPRSVHLRIVDRVAARQDHIAKALAVGAGKAAMLLEPGERVMVEHFRPGVSVIAGRIAVAPNMEK